MIRPVRSLRNVALPVFAFSLFLGALAVPATAQDAASPSPANLLPAPVMPVPPLLDRHQVDRAVDRLDAVVEDVMETTGVPGVAVAVVYRDEVLFAKGFGLREAGRPEPVDTDTVFLLASLSKPIASTLVAGLVGDGLLTWDQRVRGLDPSFALSDPYVSDHATAADLMSHRSGLATGAGDLLEDLGFDRETILSRIDQQPLDPFRSTYHYSNLGYTAGAVAAAKAAGQPFEDLATAALPAARHDPHELSPRGLSRPRQPGEDPCAGRRASRRALGGALRTCGGRRGTGRWRQRLGLGYGPLPAPATRQGSFRGCDPDRRKCPGNDPSAAYPNRLPADPAIRAGFYGLGWNVGTDDQAE